MDLTAFGPYALNVRTNIFSHGPRVQLIRAYERLKLDLKNKLQKQVEDETQANLQNSNTMKFNRQFKTDFRYENYLRTVENRKPKNTLTKLRISAHRLHIEIGIYKGTTII